jgi:hypothetical protein
MFQVQFVQAIAASPTVLLDLNNGSPWRTLANGTDLSPPPLNRALAGSLLMDGQTVSAAAYDNRVVTLVLQMQGTITDDAAATAMQALVRQVDMVDNILLWQPNTTAPVFFRTLRSAINNVVWEPVEKTATVQLLAEPFAYGLMETIADATINNDPAAVSNGMYFDVASPKGDVETPLFLGFRSTGSTGSATDTSNGVTAALAVNRKVDVTAAPFVLQCEAMSQVLNTTVQPNDAAMSGAGNNFSRCTFATTSGTRLSVAPFPAVGSASVRGTYRVFIRVRKSVSADTIQVRVVSGSSRISFTGDYTTVAVGTVPQWVDLGQLPFPGGIDPIEDGFSGTPLVVDGWPAINIDANRVTGTGNLDLDCLLFIPADDRFSLITWPASGTSGTKFVCDPNKQIAYGVTSGGAVTTATAPIVNGRLPYITPGQTNRVVFMRDAPPTVRAGGDDITLTTVVSPYYWPRYLYVRPATT